MRCYSTDTHIQHNRVEWRTQMEKLECAMKTGNGNRNGHGRWNHGGRMRALHHRKVIGELIDMWDARLFKKTQKGEVVEWFACKKTRRLSVKVERYRKILMVRLSP